MHSLNLCIEIEIYVFKIKFIIGLSVKWIQWNTINRDVFGALSPATG